MQQLYFIKKGRLEWKDVPAPVITDDKQAVVRPFAVAKCDLDDVFLFGHTELKIRIGQMLGLVDKNYRAVFGSFLKGPFPFGHECVAEVIETGSSVRNFSPGDVVSVPFQISCGECLHCSKGLTSVCVNTPPVSTFGFGKHLQFGGAMADFLKVPFADAMLLKIPPRYDPVHLASLADNIPDAYRHLHSVASNPDQKVLILGGKAKSVGLYALLLAKTLKVAEVHYTDQNRERQETAIRLKADKVYTSYREIKGRYDLVIDADSTASGLETAIRCVKNFGTVSSSGIYIKKTSPSFIEMYATGMNFRIGFANARTEAQQILDLLEKTTIPFELITTLHAGWNEAQEAFLTESTKVIVSRDRIHTHADSARKEVSKLKQGTHLVV